jgi:O-antigen/teichoic acid export membrane protein
LGEVSITPPASLEKSPDQPTRLTNRLSRNVLFSLARVAVNSLVALVLPAYLTHHLPVATYSAWVLILQLGAFVSFLDFGIQTGVAKFVAEYEARGDDLGAGRYASAGLVMMSLTGLLGVALTLVLAWQVPRLFHNMPANLYQDVRLSVLLVGVSLSVGLVCSVFSSVFLGLQRYAVPMGIAILSKMAFTVAVLSAAFLHSNLAVMGAAVAFVNLATGALQVLAWRQMSSRIRVSFALADSLVLKQMSRYCILLAIWIVGMVCVNGLDVTIVGHYSYDQTAYYSIASLPVSFLLLIISSVLGPMMPASSALSTQRSAAEMGTILARTTRYSTLLLFLTGLPLIVCGLPILRLWVGPLYAVHSLNYLRILVVANIIRNLCAPYATMITATGQLGAATAAPVCEAVLNLGSSIYLANHFGAMGVAIGTMLGAFLSISLHFVVSMRYSRQKLAILRSRFFMSSMLRPAITALPSVLLLPIWLSSSQKALTPSMTMLWGLSTFLLAWFVGLHRDERNSLVRMTRSRLLPIFGLVN